MDLDDRLGVETAGAVSAAVVGEFRVEPFEVIGSEPASGALPIACVMWSSMLRR